MKRKKEPKFTDEDLDVLRLIVAGLREPGMTANKLFQRTIEDCKGDEARARRLIRFAAEGASKE